MVSSFQSTATKTSLGGLRFFSGILQRPGVPVKITLPPNSYDETFDVIFRLLKVRRVPQWRGGK